MSENKTVETIGGLRDRIRCFAESQCQESEPLTQENLQRELWMTQNPDPLGSEYEFHFDKKEAESEGWDVVHFREVIPPEVKELPDSEGWWWEKSASRARLAILFPGFDTIRDKNHALFKKGEWIKVPNPHGDGQ